MGKRKASSQKTPKKPVKKARRAGYTTVPRTRGVYAKGEMKYFDTEKDQTAIAASTNWTGTEYDPATFNCLFVPVQGAAINQRIGRAVKVLKLKMRGFIVCSPQVNAIAGDAATIVRLILYQDCQTNSTQAQGEDVMQSPTTANAPLASNTFQNINNFGRFRVLKDKVFSFMNPNMGYDGTNLEQAGLIKPFKFNVVFNPPIEVRFNATNGGSVADIIDNSFHVIANISSADLTPYISYQCRVCFKE